MPLLLHQRIYDNGLGQYVIYAKYEVDTAPAASETIPNYTGSLVTASHEVYKVEEVDPLFHETDGDTIGLWDLNGALTATTGPNLAVSAGSELYTPAASPDEQAFWFNGSTRLEVSDLAFQLQAAMTVMFLINPSRVETALRTIIQFGTAGETEATNVQWRAHLESGNRLGWLQESGVGIDRVYDSTYAVPVGQPTHVAWTRDNLGTGLTLYVQGEQRGSSTLAAAPTGGGSGVLAIGGFPTVGTQYMQGMLSSPIVKDVEMRASPA